MSRAAPGPRRAVALAAGLAMTLAAPLALAHTAAAETTDPSVPAPTTTTTVGDVRTPQSDPPTHDEIVDREVQRYIHSGDARADQDDPGLAPLVEPEPEPEPSSACDKPGLFDVGGRVCKAINDWFRNLVADALGPLLDLVGQTVFATPDVSAPGRARDLWLVAMGVANGLFVLIVVIGGVAVMGNETVQTSYTLKEALPRIVVGWVGANLSLWAVGEMIRLANAASRTFLGSARTDRDVAAEGLKTLALEPFGRNGGLPVTLLLLVVVVLAVGILATYVVRVANVVVLTVAAPLLIAAYALPRGEGAARLWWRALCGCLLVQVGQSLMLASALRVLFDSDGQRALGIPGGALMDVVVVGCLFWGMLTLPTYAGRLVFAPRPTSIARTYVMGRGVRRAIGAGR
ncbi:MAG: hypothetical protein QOK43_1116 [Acidimicrobiaceae bacterium]|nr:hypothetical protein [Acidimicrobiaceae bacterium]